MKKKFFASVLLLFFIGFTMNTAVFAAPGPHGPNPNGGGKAVHQMHNYNHSQYRTKPHAQPRPKVHHQPPVAHHNPPRPHTDVYVQNSYYYDRRCDNGSVGIGVAATVLGVLAIGAGIAAVASY